MAALTYRGLLKPGLHKLIGFAHRQQGLIVAPRNPLRIDRLSDLKQPGIRYVNRAHGTGTRVLLDDLLAEAGMTAPDIHGNARQEPSHTAVAQVVVIGAADAGRGIEAAAREKRLGFVPLTRERYHLVCLKSELPAPPLQALLRELHSRAWQAALNNLPGYQGDLALRGKLLSLRAALPWWNNRKPRTD